MLQSENAALYWQCRKKKAPAGAKTNRRERNAKMNKMLANDGTKTLNELDYGCRPEDMGTTGLVTYVRGHHWPYVPESTCFVARFELANEIITKRHGAKAVPFFYKAVYAGRNSL